VITTAPRTASPCQRGAARGQHRQATFTSRVLELDGLRVETFVTDLQARPDSASAVRYTASVSRVQRSQLKRAARVSDRSRIRAHSGASR